MTKTDKAIQWLFCSLWVARLCTKRIGSSRYDVLPRWCRQSIAYPLAVLSQAFLVKETL
jgi:hypothetical protein